jgi:hypothetical protein
MVEIKISDLVLFLILNVIFQSLNKYRSNKEILTNKAQLKLPKIKDENGWSEFTFKRQDMNNSPLLSIILQLEEVCALQLAYRSISTHLTFVRITNDFSWIQPHVDTLINYHIQWLEKIELNKYRIEWLFALLLALEKPLDPDTSANLRVLLRKCCTARSKVVSD